MRILSWNLNGLDDLHLDDRTEAAVFLAVTGQTLRQLASGRPTRPAPDVLLLQEITPRTFVAHIATHLPRAGYALYPESSPQRETFEVIAVRHPGRIRGAQTVPLERSQYGRELHIADIDGVSGMPEPIRVLTAHFDSGVSEGSVRLAETRQVFAAMTGPAIFGGDTNLRDSEWNQLTARPTDAWEAVGSPKDLAKTWRLAGRGARFDRFWITDGIDAVSLSAVGAARLPGLPDGPSDHIGLLLDCSPQPAR